MKTNQNKRGRKPKVYSQELIKELIYRFTQERKITGLIKYMDVYRFSLELYRKEILKLNLVKISGERREAGTYCN